MIRAAAAILITLLAAPPAEPDYRLFLGYYTRPPDALEWSLTITRRGSAVSIDYHNFRGITGKRELDLDRYRRLITRLDGMRLWRLADRHAGNSRSPYYEVAVAAGELRHRFVVDEAALRGDEPAYRQIVREIVNTARFARER